MHELDGFAQFWAHAGTPSDARTWRLRARSQQALAHHPTPVPAMAPQQRPREHRPSSRVSRSTPTRGDPDSDPALVHPHDREVIAAVWRRQRAKAGNGYQFKIRPGAVA